MKKSSMASFAVCFCAILLTACDKDEQPPQATIDVRDFKVGSYVCEVTKTNYQTDVVLDNYTDTIYIAKKGEDKLLVNNLVNIQLPEVTYIEGNQNHSLFAALVTVVAFNKEVVNITHGHDSAFYELRGTRQK